MTTTAPPAAAPSPPPVIGRPGPFERTVLAGLARGRSLRGIADDLGSPHTYATVHHAVATMRHRYRARDSAALIKGAYDRGHMDDVPAEPRRQVRVTERMRQVLRGMALGQLNAEIGRELYLTENTIKIHVARTLRELDAVNRTHAVALDCQHHYSDQPTVSLTGKRRAHR